MFLSELLTYNKILRCKLDITQKITRIKFQPVGGYTYAKIKLVKIRGCLKIEYAYDTLIANKNMVPGVASMSSGSDSVHWPIRPCPHPVRQSGHKISKIGATRCQVLRLKCT